MQRREKKDEGDKQWNGKGEGGMDSDKFAIIAREWWNEATQHLNKKEEIQLTNAPCRKNRRQSMR